MTRSLNEERLSKDHDRGTICLTRYRSISSSLDSVARAICGKWMLIDWTLAVCEIGQMLFKVRLKVLMIGRGSSWRIVELKGN
jgi:hypothetical protein